MSNKITTQGYFIKRLKDSGYHVWKIFENFGEADPRAWTIVIDPGGASVFCTCYINEGTFGLSSFELYDGGQFIPQKVKIATESIEVIISYLVKFNINNKTPGYTGGSVSYQSK